MTPADARDPVGRLTEWANAMPEHWVILGHGGTSMPVADLRAVLRRLEEAEAVVGLYREHEAAVQMAHGPDCMYSRYTKTYDDMWMLETADECDFVSEDDMECACGKFARIRAAREAIRAAAPRPDAGGADA